MGFVHPLTIGVLVFDLCLEHERLRAHQILEVQNLKVPLNILWGAPTAPQPSQLAHICLLN